MTRPWVVGTPALAVAAIGSVVSLLWLDELTVIGLWLLAVVGPPTVRFIRTGRAGSE